MEIEVNSVRWHSLENLPNEIWKEIKGYEGLYEVSNKGRIKTLKYNHGNKHKILKCNIKKNRYGYLSVTLCKNKIHKDYSIHRLVATHFIPNPKNLYSINHIDENKKNNCVENLEWCTIEYNNNYGNHIKNITKIKIEKYGKRINQYTTDGEYLKTWDCISQTQKTLKINNISACLSGKQKTAGGFIWKYADEDCKNEIIMI